MQYKDLYALLAAEPKVKSYFDSLPDYVREQISTRPDGVNSRIALESYAEKLLAGDD